MLQAEVAALRHRIFEWNETEWDALEAARGRPDEDQQLDLEDVAPVALQPPARPRPKFRRRIVEG